MQATYTVTALLLALAVPSSLNCGPSESAEAKAPSAATEIRTEEVTSAMPPPVAPGAEGPGIAQQPETSQAPAFELPADAYKIPTDVTPILEQETANEFAWQSFIAVNWPAATGKGTERGTPDQQRPFGSPGPVVWETYKNVHFVFLDEGRKPNPWNVDGYPIQDIVAAGEQGPKEEDAERSMPRVSKAKPEAHRIGTLLNQIQAQRQEGVSEFQSSILEAAPSVASWLVAQNQTLTRFEVFINKTVFDYIYEHGFYDARNQAKAVAPGGPGIASPFGAMELKAAWIEITEGMDPSRYHTTEATLDTDPTRENDPSRKALMGLVGLHIIHKTPNAPQYVWATFEHVDNCPDIGSDGSGQDWHYYSDTLDPDKINLTPQSNPIQVKRITPLPDAVNALNAKYQGAIRLNDKKHGIQSPWSNYQLVNTQWPSNSVTIPPLTKLPLPKGNAIPRIVANTTMETYVQDKSCLDCHVFAGVSGSSGDPNAQAFATDYSFVYGMAKSPGSSKSSR